jgi:hypothetical protein
VQPRLQKPHWQSLRADQYIVGRACAFLRDRNQHSTCWLVNKVLTLQTYKRWRSLEVGQKMFAENPFHLVIEERWITVLIFQLHHNIAPELVILGEHRYHWN